MRGVVPALFALSLSAPCYTRHCTIDKSPLYAALKSAVLPSLSASSLSTPCLRSNCTRFKLPYSAALCKFIVTIQYSELFQKLACSFSSANGKSFENKEVEGRHAEFRNRMEEHNQLDDLVKRKHGSTKRAAGMPILVGTTAPFSKNHHKQQCGESGT